jgi:hypothetical protein
MEGNRFLAAVWIGGVGGVVTIVGPAFPWLIVTNQQPSVSLGGFAVSPFATPFAVFFGVAMVVTSISLLTEIDTMKSLAILGAASLAVLAMSVPVAVHKDATLFAGALPSEALKIGVGLWATIVGGTLGLVATAIAAKILMKPTSVGGEAGASFDLGEVSQHDD